MFPPRAESIAGGNADAAGQANGWAVAVDPHLGNAIQDPLRDRTRGGRIGAAEDDEELLATVASDDIRLAQLGLDRTDDRPEAGVARGVAIGIVDLLEMIEIDEEEGNRQTARAGSHRCCLQTFEDR